MTDGDRATLAAIMRALRRAVPLVTALLAGAAARADSIQVREQSPAGVATVGAMTARHDEASAVFYNPGAMAFLRGVSFVGGASFVAQEVSAATTPPAEGRGYLGLPVVHLTLRVGNYLAFGVGIYSQYAGAVSWPAGWPGRELGQRLRLYTTTINPSVAIRPLPWVAAGFGIDIVPGGLEWETGLAAPAGALAGATSATNGVGLGGNLGLLFRIVPRYLYLGATYRSSIDVTLTGDGTLDRSGTPSLPQNVTVTVPLPHNLSVGLSSEPKKGLILDLDAHVTFWRDLNQLTALYQPVGADPSRVPDQVTLDLNLRDAYGFRLGGELRLLEDRLRLRLGVGFDVSPVRRGWLQPLWVDNHRVLVGAGFGYHHGMIGVEAGYSIQIQTGRTSSYPFLPVAFGGLTHTASLALVVHLPNFPRRVNLPEYKY
jgi:long-chain fatty acid transport protein